MSRKTHFLVAVSSPYLALMRVVVLEVRDSVVNEYGDRKINQPKDRDTNFTFGFVVSVMCLCKGVYITQ